MGAAIDQIPVFGGPAPEGQASSLPSDPSTWQTFRKTAVTRATRIQGRFGVHTTEGYLECEDGWLAIDARGYPYPIEAAEFALIYQEVPDDPGVELILGQHQVATVEAIEQELLATVLQQVRQQYAAAKLEVQMAMAGHPEVPHANSVKKKVEGLRRTLDLLDKLVAGGEIPEPSGFVVPEVVVPNASPSGA